MKLYVATAEPYHDNSTIVGVFETLEAAQAAFPSSPWEGNGEGAWIVKLDAAHTLKSQWFAAAFEIRLIEVGAALAAHQGTEA